VHPAADLDHGRVFCVARTELLMLQEAKTAMQYLNLIQESMRDRRRYASWFEGSRREKSAKEVGIVNCLLESFEEAGSCEYPNLRTSTLDPPDCLANTPDGALVGFEVRELVDQEVVELNKRGIAVYRDWTDSDVIDVIETILQEKDSKNYIGGPYEKLVLVVHTAESDLTHRELRPVLNSHAFTQTKKLHQVYVLFPYDPETKRYPYIQLKTAK